MNPDSLAILIIFLLFMCLIIATFLYLRHVSAKADAAVKRAEEAYKAAEKRAAENAPAQANELTDAEKREIERAVKADAEYRRLMAMSMPPMVNHAAGVVQQNEEETE